MMEKVGINAINPQKLEIPPQPPKLTIENVSGLSSNSSSSHKW